MNSQKRGDLNGSWWEHKRGSRNIRLAGNAFKFKIKCKVINYKHESYRVQVLKGDKLIMPIQIAEENVKESNPKENLIPDKLKTLLTNLESY